MSISPSRALVCSILVLAGCAATTPAPRFSAVSPADADAPEAGSPPPVPSLAVEPEAAARPQPGAGHQGHASPAEAAGTQAEQPTAATPYSCPMHPDLKQAAPGTCPRCGMRLVERKPRGPRP